MTGYLKLAILAGTLAAGFGGGWVVNGWRMGEEAATVAKDHAEEKATQWREATREVSRLADEARALQAQVTAAAQAGRQQTEIAQNETNRLRRCLDNGTCGLRVNVIAQPPGPDVPPASDGRPVGVGTPATLAPDSRQAYLDLLDGIAVTEGKLLGCQKALGTFGGVLATTPAAW